MGGAIWIEILLIWFLPHDFETELAPKKHTSTKNRQVEQHCVWKEEFWFWPKLTVSLNSNLSVILLYLTLYLVMHSQPNLHLKTLY